MEYTVYADNNIIYSRTLIGTNGNQLYTILDPVLDETVDGFCNLTYRCKAGSAAYDRSVEMIPRIKIYEDGDLYWTGRILKVTPNIYAEKEVYVEDFLGVLCDGIYRPFDFYGTVNDFLNLIVNENNNQVSESQQIYGIVCDVNVGNIVRSSEGYNTCWTIIKEKLLNMIGGFMWISYDAQERAILHYSLNARNTSTQYIRFAENLKTYQATYDYDGFYTACVPLGAKDDETKEYVTIASVNDDKDYLIDTDNAARYGIIYAPTSETTWEDVHEPSTLLTRAQTWLQTKASRLTKEVRLTAVDLSALDVNTRAFKWLDAVNVEIDGTVETFVIKNLKRPLDQPLQIEISMGDVRTSLTGSSTASKLSISKRVESIESDYMTDGQIRQAISSAVDGLASDIREELLDQSTSIRQYAEEILLQALSRYVSFDDLGNYNEETILSEISQAASEISATFTSTISSLRQDVDDNTASIDSITSYVTIMPTTQDQEGGVVIGESTSDIKLKAENDVIYYFSGDPATVSKQTAIMYLADRELFVEKSSLYNMSIGQVGAQMNFQIVGTGNLRCLLLSPKMIDS